jgi:hypothetical protein
MTIVNVTIVRIYLTESSGKLEALLKRLHDWEKVKGVTVFRGISGYGDSGNVHSSRFVDLSLDLPLVVEFFDEPEKVAGIIENIQTNIKPMHMLWWNAKVNQ